jgi:hypothetical protein
MNNIEKILLFVAHQWIITKDTVMLLYGSNGTFVAKNQAQSLFYVGSLAPK